MRASPPVYIADWDPQSHGIISNGNQADCSESKRTLVVHSDSHGFPVTFQIERKLSVGRCHRVIEVRRARMFPSQRNKDAVCQQCVSSAIRGPVKVTIADRLQKGLGRQWPGTVSKQPADHACVERLNVSVSDVVPPTRIAVGVSEAYGVERVSPTSQNRHRESGRFHRCRSPSNQS
jgi:hypothetical protein